MSKRCANAQHDFFARETHIFAVLSCAGQGYSVSLCSLGVSRFLWKISWWWMAVCTEAVYKLFLSTKVTRQALFWMVFVHWGWLQPLCINKCQCVYDFDVPWFSMENALVVDGVMHRGCLQPMHRCINRSPIIIIHIYMGSPMHCTQ